jgi:hypothetical protein
MADGAGSEESFKARADRRYEELLQELRVAQAGVQILFAFLLVLPFQSGFPRLPGDLKSLYAAALLSSLVAAALLIGPVALHRILSGEQMKDAIVERAHRMALGGLAFLAASMSGAVALALSVSAGRLVGLVVGLAALVLFASLWFVWPVLTRRQTDATKGSRAG